MRHWFLYLILNFALGCSCFAQITSSNSNQEATTKATLSIVLSTSGQPLKVGAPINVIVAFTNGSQSDIEWASQPNDPGYRDARYSLKFGNSEVPKTKFYRMLRGEYQAGDPQAADGGSTVSVPLHPGQSVRATFDLNKLYEIDRPGTYVFTAERYDAVTKSFVRSNQLLLMLGPNI